MVRDINKLNMESKNILSENIEKVAELFPNCIVEAEEGKKIDFDILKQELSKDIIEGNRERYHLDFPGKREAIVEANRKTTKTLRPLKDKSVDFDNTKNIYIEGDNLEALKILQESYLGKIKCIYIDPPYNTGNDFVYNDKFSHTTVEELKASGRMDEDGNILISKDINNDSNGRYHSDWLKMMYPRLKLARNLLSDDGVIFISIDDNELENLIQVCNDLYGETNKIGILKWKKKKQPSFASNHIATVIEYVLVYGKNRSIVSKFSIENISDATKKVINIYNPISTRIFKDGVIVKGMENGIIKAGKYLVKTMTVEYLNDINVLNGITTNKVEVRAKFLNTQENIDKFIENKLLFITEKKGLRRYVSEEEKSNEKLIVDLLLDWGDNQESEKEQKSIFGTVFFDYAKPTLLLHNIINSITQPNDIILDFFSGSATTAHAVMKLNAEDGGNRQFILVQLPEATDEDSEAYKAGYKTICDIGEERIRRAGKKIKEENPLITKDLDIGFRVYKVDDSNMKDIYYTPDKIDQKNILDMVSNVKEDRNALDLLTQVMLNLGLPLDLHIEEKKIGKNNVFFVENNSLVACFDDKVDISILDEISKVSPLKICLRESSFSKDQDKINFFERLKKLSADTEVTII